MNMDFLDYHVETDKNDVDHDQKSSCGHKHCNHKKSCHMKKHFPNCVEKVLKAILKAQRKVKQQSSCETSCAKSIDDLLGEKKESKHNTIPVILYCDCHPFLGTGAFTYYCKSKTKRFKCVNTFIFKVKDIKDGCAVLELLTFRGDLKHSSCPRKGESHLCCPCCQIDHKKVHDLIGTGICINVDLSCFCAVSCLDPVNIK